MEASAAGQDMVGAKPDCGAVREECLNDIDRSSVIGGAVLRHHDYGVADVKVHIARRDDVAVLVRDPPR